MEKLILTRQYLDNCVLGKIYYNGSFICHTVEKPYISNAPNISCIPPGIYQIHRHHTQKYPDTFVLRNHDLGIGINEHDSLRYSCCIHIANYPTQVEGCIGPGLEQNATTYGVSRSKDAMDVLRKLISLESEEWELEII